MGEKQCQSSGSTNRVSPIRSNLAEHLVLLCASALFKDLSQHQCIEIASCARARTFARDEILFSQGDPNRHFTILLSGIVKLTQIGSNGNEVLLWMSGKGDPLNAVLPAPTCSHTCSARAMEQCKALVWEYHQLQRLLDEYPQIRKNMSQILSGRLSELEERFREVATEKVAKRLALALLRLIRHVGKPTPAGVEVTLSREELAQMTGATLFTISRTLSRWAEEGFVIPRREAVVVSVPEKLESVAEKSH